MVGRCSDVRSAQILACILPTSLRSSCCFCLTDVTMLSPAGAACPACSDMVSKHGINFEQRESASYMAPCIQPHFILLYAGHAQGAGNV